MNVSVTCNGTNITQYVTEYDNEKAVCTGVGLCRVQVSLTTPIMPEIYNSVVIWEDGVKKGTFYVHTIDKDVPTGTMTLNCQDASLKLQTYFIHESFYIDYPSNSKYWIEKFLTDATVDYVFDDSASGTLISNNTTLGMTTAMDAIIPLLQQNGWYLYFDADNTCHIGKIATNPESPDAVITDDTITDIHATFHDKMFRNRIIVWGSTTKNGQWIFVDLDKSGNYPNEYGSGDKRTSVISNSSIGSIADASAIAGKALKEFDKTNEEVALQVAGSLDLHLGDYIHIRTEKFNSGGMITTLGSSLSANGLYTNIIIGERCPRLFSFYNFGGYVYVGTDGAGVWRKPIEDTHTWSDFSSGIPAGDKSITDLAIDNGRYACTTTLGNLYLNYGGGWSKFNPGSIRGTNISGESIVFPASSGEFVNCTFDKQTGDVIGAFSISGDIGVYSWLYFIRSHSVFSGVQLKDDNDFSGYTVLGLDNNGIENIVSVVTSSDGTNYLWNGRTHSYAYNYAESNTTVYIEKGAYYYNNNNETMSIGINPNDHYVVADGKYIFYVEKFWISGDWYLSIKMIDTNEDALITFGNTFWFEDLVVDGDVRAIGNKCLAFAFYDSRQAYYLKIVDYAKDEIREVLLNIDYDDSIEAVGVAVINGDARYYMLVIDWDSVNFTLYYYSVKKNILVLAGGGSVPQNYHGEWYVTIVETNLMISDSGHMYCVLRVGYDEFTPGSVNWGYEDVYFSVYANLNQLFVPVIVTTDITDYLLSLGDVDVDPATDSASLMQVASRGEYLFLSLYVEYRDSEFESYYEYIVFRVKNGALHGISAVGPEYFKIVSNKTTTYVINYYGYMYNADTGIFIKQLSLGWDIDNISGYMDDVLPGILYYDEDTGNIYKYILDTENIIEFPLELFPHTDDEFYLSSVILQPVFDSVYVHLKSYKYTGQAAMRYGLIAPSGTTTDVLLSGYGVSGISVSGNRLFEADYTVISVGDERILQGYKGAYSMVMDVAIPHDVEISQRNMVALWGGISYSGLLISGVQTGYEYGQIYLSPTGKESTYTRVVLDSLSGVVSDVRTFNALVKNEGADYVEHKSYCVFPQTRGLGSELILMDISNVTSAPGVIVATSGTLNTGSYVLETFSGVLNHVETTNTQDVPYIFVSTAGVPPTFFQKDAYSVGEPITYFEDRTNNLPAAAITCIRCDDKI